MMQVRHELRAVVEDIRFGDEPDTLIWCYTKTRTYTSQSFYSIINYIGITPLYIPVVWSIVVPPKIHMFLWLLSHNKLAIVDNLNRNGFKKPSQCRFCDEHENIDHLFFECVVAKTVWGYAKEFLGVNIGDRLHFSSIKMVK
jgi:hypothetical protein